eukprot:6972354-Prymnesium_polylepis.1
MASRRVAVASGTHDFQGVINDFEDILDKHRARARQIAARPPPYSFGKFCRSAQATWVRTTRAPHSISPWCGVPPGRRSNRDSSSRSGNSSACPRTG